MARIRTIKPEFWSSEQVMECSRDARLLFIGIWNFCDDAGNHVASPKTIKAEIFPGDDLTSENVRRLLDELVSNGLLVEYSHENKDFYHVTGWHHQRIDRPTFKHPPFPDEESEGTRRALDEPSPPEGKGREGKGVEGNGRDIPTPNGVGVGFRSANPDQAAPGEADELKLEGAPNDKRNVCPVTRIVAMYHEKLPQLPRVEKITKTREGQIRQRWRDDLPDLKAWERFFDDVSKSTFLMGRAPGRDGRPPFIADLQWLTKDSNFAHIAEGKYHR